jgi:hypothetical protein
VPVTPIYRKPLLQVTANAALISKVSTVQITRGWDQLVAKADLTVPYPPPAQLGIGARVQIRGGITSAPLRFTGFVTGYGVEYYPNRWTYPLGDALWLAENYHPTTTHDLSNKTDQQAWVYILTVMGLVFNPSLILGTGKKIGKLVSAALTWGPDTSAGAMFRRIDEVSIVDHGSGYLTQFRGWVDFGGQIRRSEIANFPGLTAARTFAEGIGLADIVEGSLTVDKSHQPRTSVTAIGNGVSSTFNGTNAFATISNPWSWLYPMLQVATADAESLSTSAVAQFMLQKLGMNLVTINFKTPREDLIAAIETDHFDSVHERMKLNAFVQSVVTGWFEDGEFSQQITLISERTLNLNPNAPGQTNPNTGVPIIPDPPEIVPVPPDTVTAQIEVLFIKPELVIIADVETLIYTVVCRDTSTSSGGAIVSRAWTTTGGASPPTGDDVSFNPSWTAEEMAAGPTVTLTVTGSVGGTDAITLPISLTMGVPVRVADIFAAETTALAAFKGADNTWRVYTTGITAATVVANGPLWAQGETVYRSSDYLATAPSTSVPLAGANVLSIWTEPDLDADAVAVGLSDGFIALSSDGGATWDAKAGPDVPSPVLKIILSRFNPGQIHAITATGYYLSTDAGENWGLIRAGDYRDLDLNQFRNWAIEVDGTGGMIEAASGSAITGAADDLVAVTSHILQDRGYALAADGSTYLLDEDGATALTAGTAIPAGSPQTRGMYRDGAAPDVAYFAAGTGGVWKTTDGFRATYFQLRKSGVGNAGSGPWPMVGAGGLAVAAPPPPPPGETSPPGTPGACVGAVVPLAFIHVGASAKAFNLTAEESRDDSLVEGPHMFAPNTNVVHVFSAGAQVWRSEDGLCTVNALNPFFMGGGVWALDCFNHFLYAASGPNAGVWFGADGVTFTQLPGGTIGGVGPSTLAAGNNKIWMRIGGQVYWMPRAGGTPQVGGYSGGQVLGGYLNCGRVDDSYCISFTPSIFSGDLWYRITATSWSDISASVNAAGPVSISAFPAMMSIDGTTWVGLSAQGFIRSVNAGATWAVAQSAPPGVGERFRSNLSYSATQNRWWATGPHDGTGNSRIWYSDNAGQSWTPLTLFVTTSHIVAVGSSS